MKIISILIISFAFTVNIFAQNNWQPMSEAQLKQAVPEKAPVISENIETEFRTASGIINGKNLILGVVIITAGYEADGKYTHFLRTLVKMKIGALTLEPKDYIFGYKRVDNETLKVMFYRAKDGKMIGATKAKVEKSKGPIYSFLIAPQVASQGKIFIGRFSFDYSVE